MNEKAMSMALDRIHDEAVALLKFTDSPEVSDGLGRIIALARYKYDVLPHEESSSRQA